MLNSVEYYQVKCNDCGSVSAAAATERTAKEFAHHDGFVGTRSRFFGSMKHWCRTCFRKRGLAKALKELR